MYYRAQCKRKSAQDIVECGFQSSLTLWSAGFALSSYTVMMVSRFICVRMGWVPVFVASWAKGVIAYSSLLSAAAKASAKLPKTFQGEGSMQIHITPNSEGQSAALKYRLELSRQPDVIDLGLVVPIVVLEEEGDAVQVLEL